MIWRKSFLLRWDIFLGFCVLAITVLANNETHLPYSPTAFSAPQVGKLGIHDEPRENTLLHELVHLRCSGVQLTEVSRLRVAQLVSAHSLVHEVPSSTVAHKDKTLPRIQKHFPESKNTSQNPKHFPESKNTSQNPKHFPEFKNTFQNQKHFPEFKNTFQNPDSGKCFGFWEVFLDSGTCFGFWEVLCPYEPP